MINHNRKSLRFPSLWPLTPTFSALKLQKLLGKSVFWLKSGLILFEVASLTKVILACAFYLQHIEEGRFKFLSMVFSISFLNMSKISYIQVWSEDSTIDFWMAKKHLGVVILSIMTWSNCFSVGKITCNLL